MYKTIPLLLVILFACSPPAKKKVKPADSTKEDKVITLQTNDLNAANKNVEDEAPLPVVKTIKKPCGIYHVFLPLEKRTEQTILFNNDLTYCLQEKYPDAKDSIIIEQGNWMPSDGYIWLYKDQIERGRYKWRGDTLQYFSPLLKKNFSMQQLSDASADESVHQEGKNGVIVYGISNEPFWSVEYNNKDTISFLLGEWEHPLKMKVQSKFSTADSSGYIARNDSAEIRITVLPYFCIDNITNQVYRKQIKVRYNHQVYNGCGIVYKYP